MTGTEGRVCQDRLCVYHVRGGDDPRGSAGASGSFDFDEIMDICMLTFKDFSSNKDEGEEETEEDKKKAEILEETARFQAKNIFKLLGFEVDDEIPIDVFKDQIFNGDYETRQTLR